MWGLIQDVCLLLDHFHEQGRYALIGMWYELRESAHDEKSQQAGFEAICVL